LELWFKILMYVTVVPNRGSPPAILLRETYRDGAKVKNRALANLTKWKPEKIAALRAVLRDEALAPAGKPAAAEAGGFEILRSLPHGRVAAVFGIARRIGLDPRVKSADLMPPGPERTRLLALAVIVARRRSPVAKAKVSPAARRKAATKRTDDGMPVHSFRTLLTDLATLTRNTVRFGKGVSATILATPTKGQQRAFDLLAVQPASAL
jgi:hypothetical protein